MRRLIPGLLLLLTACPKASEKDAGTARPSAAPTNLGATDVGVELAAAEIPTPTETATPSEARGACPPWVRMKACRDGDQIFAAGLGPETVLAGLARSSAIGRGKMALARALGRDGEVTLKDVEIIDTAACDEAVHALLRTRAPDAPGDIHPCLPNTVHVRAPVPAGCPAWVNRVAWIEDGKRHAVGVAPGLKNRALQTAAAKNRALANAEQSKLSKIQVGGGGTSVSMRANSSGAKILATESAECGGRFYTKVTLAL